MKPKENLLRAIRRDGPAWVPEGLDGPVYMANAATIWPPVVERPEQAGLDAFGVRWDLREHAEGGTFPAHGGHTIIALARWRDEITIPAVDQQDWAAVRAEADRVDRDENLVMGFVEMGLFERSYLLLGMEEALIGYMTAPDQMYELLGAIADYKIELIARFHDEVGLDMVWYGDDWGTQQGLFIPPESWRRIIKPHTQRIYDCMRRRHILINQHSCGRIEAIFADMVEIGADMWNPCQPCNDLAGLKRRYGDRIAFHGGIDSQFVLDRPGVTADEVRAEVRRCIDTLAAGGGYIAGPSHYVPRDPEIQSATKDEVETYGRMFYTDAGRR
ncbi:MAG: methyltransferase [Phycisphaerae bacterium]|nr:methyltransferase [Phycisphaerae bacterium]